jgi:glutamate/tyrosine decarboxylase-like PLP-dependent enzyme
MKPLYIFVSNAMTNRWAYAVKILSLSQKKGLHGLPRLVLFTSEDAHYSIKKMASLLGLGSDNVYLIRCNAKGKMDVQHLEQEIQRALEEGAAPFMVSATAGDRNNKDLQSSTERA